MKGWNWREWISPTTTPKIISKDVAHWMRDDWDEPFEVVGSIPKSPAFIDGAAGAATLGTIWVQCQERKIEDGSYDKK